MKILVAGGSGFVGHALIEALLKEGHEVELLTRRPEAAARAFEGRVQTHVWDAQNPGDWTGRLSQCRAVINLTGENIAGKRWSAKQKQKIIDSRIQSTRVLAQAIVQAAPQPEVFINASAIGFYGPQDDQPMEDGAASGRGFLAETCARWETAAEQAVSTPVRVVLLRIGVVLEKGGGALAKMLPPFYLFAGGPLGSGRQWLSWIHRTDLVRLILFALKTPALQGPVNATAPEPVRMREFCRILGNVLKRPSWAPVPGFALKLLLGQMAQELLLWGQRVPPAKALQAGFQFRFSALEAALKDILKG